MTMTMTMLTKRTGRRSDPPSPRRHREVHRRVLQGRTCRTAQARTGSGYSCGPAAREAPAPEEAWGRDRVSVLSTVICNSKDTGENFEAKRSKRGDGSSMLVKRRKPNERSKIMTNVAIYTRASKGDNDRQRDELLGLAARTRSSANTKTTPAWASGIAPALRNCSKTPPRASLTCCSAPMTLACWVPFRRRS